MNDESFALENSRNPFGRKNTEKTVLCVCSAGMLRSPTAAFTLHKLYGYNTRACGVEAYALVPLSAPLIEWADEIVCMGGAEHVEKVQSHGWFKIKPKPIRYLDIPDNFAFMDPKLVELITERYVTVLPDAPPSSGALT